jgi:hypothetical protein
VCLEGWVYYKHISVLSKLNSLMHVTGTYENIFLRDNCVLLGYYAANTDNSLPTFRDNLSDVVPKRRQGNTATRCVIAQKNAVLIYFASGA